MRAKASLLVALVVAIAAIVAACGGNDNKSSSSSSSTGAKSLKGQTITYWASNQAPTIPQDYKVLRGEAAKFTQQTGVKVNIKVIGWPDLFNNITAATTSGKGPDVLNIGNTWSASLQATGAFLPFDGGTLGDIGGKDKFLSTSFSAPTATPTSSTSRCATSTRGLPTTTSSSSPAMSARSSSPIPSARWNPARSRSAAGRHARPGGPRPWAAPRRRRRGADGLHAPVGPRAQKSSGTADSPRVERSAL